jgi:alpha-1,3-rhamnosyl/mannosyltransferase
VDPRDPEDIGQAIVSLLSDPVARAEWVQKGFERAKEFTWEATARRTLAFITSTAGPG